MDDLHMERNNHEKARNKLEAKSREVEIMRRDLAEKAAYVEQKDMELQEQAMRLAALESESREAHRKNVELSAKIEEVLAVHEEFVARADAVGTDDGAGGEGADAEALAEREALLKRLQKAEAATKLKAGQLEAVNARVRAAGRSTRGTGGGRVVFRSISYAFCVCFLSVRGVNQGPRAGGEGGGRASYLRVVLVVYYEERDGAYAYVPQQRESGADQGDPQR